MKILIETISNNIPECDGLILALDGYSAESTVTYTIDEIKDIIKDNPQKEIFIKLNKNFFNKDLANLEKILKELDKLRITGVFFYDLAVLQLKKELNLKLDLVWNQTFMVNNYTTCNYYYSKGVKYALLGKEITLDEIIEIVHNTKIIPMVEVVSMPSVAFSKRKLLTNYFYDINKPKENSLTIKEELSNKEYEVYEDKEGTSIFYKTITNGTVVIKDLYDNKVPYIIFREYGIDTDLFKELVSDTKKYIEGDCLDKDYIEKYKSLEDNTNFFFKKTIYRVK